MNTDNEPSALTSNPKGRAKGWTKPLEIDTKRELLAVSDLAHLFGAGKSTVWRWEKLGKIPASIRVGGMTRWRRADIVAFIASPQKSA